MDTVCKMCTSAKLFNCCYLILSAFYTVVSHLLCFSFSLFPFWCLQHFWQFARHGDKISEKKEQNVRMENASFVFCRYGCFQVSFSPISTTRENNAVFLVWVVWVVHNNTARRSNFKQDESVAFVIHL